MSVSALMAPVQHYIRREQVLRLAKQLPVNLLANLCVVIAFIFIFHSKVQTVTLVSWVIYSQFINLYGLYLVRKCRSSILEVNPGSCLGQFSFYAIADGLTFAASIWLFFVPGNGFHNIFLFTVLLGISAGGQTTLFSHLKSAIPFSLVISISVIIRLLLTSETNYFILAALIMVFTGVLMRIAFSFNHNLLNTWRLRYELEGELQDRKKIEAELRESEQRYRDIVELSPDAIVIQQQNVIVYINAAALNLLEKTNQNSVKGHMLSEFLTIKNTESEHKDVIDYSENSASILSGEGELRIDTNQVIDVEIRSKDIIYNGHQARQLILQDISERKHMERMKDEFISIASHELRTPVTALFGAASLIRGTMADTLGETQRNLIEIIYNNGNALSKLVHDILDVSKLEGGKLSLDLGEYGVQEILDEVLNENINYASQYKVDLVLQNELKSTFIYTDKLRLKQILNNLISNAIKHSPEHDKVVISVTHSNSELVFSIEDHGSGIPKDFQKRIFNKFEQSQDNNRKVIKGTGLGLYLSKSLVERLRGKIGYETEEGRGTTFYVKIPNSQQHPG